MPAQTEIKHLFFCVGKYADTQKNNLIDLLDKDDIEILEINQQRKLLHIKAVIKCSEEKIKLYTRKIQDFFK